MKDNWLWDRRLNYSQVKEILKNPQHKKFNIVAPLLFARNNNPKKIFKEYIDPLVFCRYWISIKKQMRKNKWDEPRIIFWQAIYENLINKYRKQGISFREREQLLKSGLCQSVGREIHQIRKNKSLSQRKLAQNLGISQQLVSRIEQGKENLSIATMEKISAILGKKIEIHFV